MVCDGTGMCLIQGDDMRYIQGTDNCQFNCRPVNCPNFKVCGATAPQRLLSCHHGLCTSCDVSFGTWRGGTGSLDFEIIEECPVCLDENLEGVRQPACTHFVCVPCFKKMQGYDFECDIPEPEFPVGIIDQADEDAFDANPEDERWAHNQVLQDYVHDHNLWENYYEYKLEEHTRNLAKCPLCRAEL